MICSTIPVPGRIASREMRCSKARDILSRVLALVTLTIPCARAQDKSQDKSQDKNKDPKVVVELEKRSPTNDSNAKEPAGADGATHLSPAEPFGKACSAVGAAKDGYRNFDRPISINELFGAPIAVVIIRRLRHFRGKNETATISTSTSLRC